MGNTKKVAMANARRLAEKLSETMLVIHDTEYSETWGENCAYYAVRESYVGDWINDPEIAVIATIEPKE